MSIDEFPSLGLVHAAIEKLQEIKKEDKPFEESGDICEVIYPGEGQLLDVHPCKDQDLSLGGLNKSEDEVSLSCPTQDED